MTWLAPPLSGWARRYEFVEALQFASFVVVIPALAVVGAPWARLGLAASEPRTFDVDGNPESPASIAGPVDRLAEYRLRHREVSRSLAFAALYLVGAVVWRTPPAVDSLRSQPWLVGVEAATLVTVGVGLWLELVESPPLTPRSTRPIRLALAAASMWAIWVLAYLVGLSQASWYPAYRHVAGSGLSLSADQQLTTGLLWFVSAVAFVPVVYWNLIRWLQAEEDPDEELRHLVRRERPPGREVGPDRPAA